MFNSTLCYLENARGEYLMLHRVKKKNDVNQDKWIGVGGKFEADESPEDCLLREVREETGLNLTRYQYRGSLRRRAPSALSVESVLCVPSVPSVPSMIPGRVMSSMGSVMAVLGCVAWVVGVVVSTVGVVMA